MTTRAARLRNALALRAPAPLFLVGLVLVTLGPPSPVRAVLAIGGIVLLPGGAILALVRSGVAPGAPRLLAAGLLGTFGILAVGFVASALGPSLGVPRPFDAEAMRAILLVPVAVLVGGGVILGRDGVRFVGEGIRGRDVVLALALAALGGAAILGGLRLTATGSADLATIVTGAIVILIVATIVAAALFPHSAPVASIAFFAVLALAYAVTSRGSAPYGWDIQQEVSTALEALDRGRWVAPADGDAYAAMLSLTVLPAAARAVAGIGVEDAMRYVYPFALAGSIVAGYLLARRVAPPAIAWTVVMTLAIASGSLARGLPAIAREEVGLFMVMAGVAGALGAGAPARVDERRGLLLVGMVGAAVTHYTTAYLMIWVLACAWVASWLIPFLRRERRVAPAISALVVALSLIATYGWNIILNRTDDSINRPLAVVLARGPGLITTGTSDFLHAWTAGSNPQTIPAAVLRSTIQAQLGTPRYAWIRPDPAAAGVTLVDDDAPTEVGPLASFAGEWTLLGTLVAQAILLLTTLGLLVAVLLAVRRRAALAVHEPDPGQRPAELVGLALGALAIVVILRISTTFAAGYNPERGLLHATLLYAPALAACATIGFAWLARNRVAAGAAVAGTALIVLVPLANATGLGAAVVAGTPAASLASYGEEVERFTVSSAEYAAARWLDRAGAVYRATYPNRGPMLVQSDRYGQPALLVVARSGTLGYLQWIDPVAVHADAFIYASRTNTVEGRARELWAVSRSVFRFPRAWFDEHRATVYANDQTRIYR